MICFPREPIKDAQPLNILTEFSIALTAAESYKKAMVRMRIIIARQQSSILTALVWRYI